jgi:hypothetical protein
LAAALAVYFAGHRADSASGPADPQAVHAAAVKLAADCTETDLLGCLEKQPSGAAGGSTAPRRAPSPGPG